MKQLEGQRYSKGSADLPKKAKVEDMTLPYTMNIPKYPGATLSLEKGVVPKGTELKNVFVIAGKGSSVAIRDIERLDKLYGGNPTEWRKLVGTAKGSHFKYEIHWYENSGFTHIDETKVVRRW